MISIPLIVIAVFLAPMVLDPLFNKFEPLEGTHAALVGELEQVVARTGTAIAPDRMFLMKASEKTNGINAYVTGHRFEQALCDVGYDHRPHARRRDHVHLRP